MYLDLTAPYIWAPSAQVVSFYSSIDSGLASLDSVSSTRLSTVVLNIVYDFIVESSLSIAVRRL